MIEFLRRRSRGFFHEFTFALFNKGRKLDRPIIRNFDAWGGASNAHGGDGGVDLHIASLGDFARNEGERSLGQIEHRRIGLPIWVIHELVQSHAGVAGNIERGAVGKVDTDPAIGPGLDHVASVDEIANLGLTGLTGDIGLNDHKKGSF